jgi:hypothetical protein
MKYKMKHAYVIILGILSYLFATDIYTPSMPEIALHIETVWVAMDLLAHIDSRPDPLVELIPNWLGLELNEAFLSQMV